MEKIRNYTLDLDFLETYQNAALLNSKELLIESQLLLENRYYARSYFLSTASIEETGKACIAYHAKSRNLNDPAVCKKVKEHFEDHFNKVIAAFIGWTDSSNKSKEHFEIIVNLMADVQNGREPSMYVDVEGDGPELSIPSKIVRPITAHDCYEVASKCLAYTELYIKKNNFPTTTPFQDKFMCLKLSTIQEITKNQNFWAFFLNELKQNGYDWARIIVKYHDEYFKKNKLFV